MCSALTKFTIELWGLVGKTRIPGQRFPENSTAGRILLSDVCFGLVQVHRTDAFFDTNKGGVSVCANIKE